MEIINDFARYSIIAVGPDDDITIQINEGTRDLNCGTFYEYAYNTLPSLVLAANNQLVPSPTPPVSPDEFPEATVQETENRLNENRPPTTVTIH